MNVILKQDVPSIGKAGDALKVADGYARNFLIPQGFAIEANTKNMKVLEHEKRNILQKSEKERSKSQDFAQKLAAVTVKIPRKVGEQDKLFGSVHTKDIEAALHELGFAIDRKTIMLHEPLKALGEYPVKIKLPASVTAEIKVAVVAE